MDDAALRRIGHNEALYREVNEAIERGLWPGDGDTAQFRCECARLQCNMVLTLSLADYERIRAHARRFFVADGHEVAEAETVVERGPGWTVVEKRGQAAAIAESTDPRN